MLLRRNQNKFKGGQWDMPGGKNDRAEDKKVAMRREIFEETGIEISKEKLRYIKKVYVRYPEFDFDCDIFYLRLETKPAVKISPQEHSEYGWYKYDTALKMDLVPDEAERIKIVMNNLEGKT